MTTGGSLTEFPVGKNTGPYEIAAGPDGALWFTELFGDKIGRITTGGTITGYPTTADGAFGGPALQAGTDRFFTLPGRCGVPSGALAVAANMTVTQATAAGSLTVFPAGVDQPKTSSINYGGGQTRANNGVLVSGVGGSIFVSCNQPSGTVHFILDVTGYFQ
jgi:hypothetical protein